MPFTAAEATALAHQEPQRIADEMFVGIQATANEGGFKHVVDGIPDALVTAVKLLLEAQGYHVDFYPTEVGCKTFVIDWPTV